MQPKSRQTFSLAVAVEVRCREADLLSVQFLGFPGITPGQELPGGWGHTKTATPETTIYQDVSSALNQVGNAAYSQSTSQTIEYHDHIRADVSLCYLLQTLSLPR
jgi:hypothetical protein